VDWLAVAAELQRGRDSQVNFGPNALQACLTSLGVRDIPDAGQRIPSMPSWQCTNNLGTCCKMARVTSPAYNLEKHLLSMKYVKTAALTPLGQCGRPALTHMFAAAREGECAAELRARLRTPRHLGSSHEVPFHLVLEVRRLRCATVTVTECRRHYRLSETDMKCLPVVKVSIARLPAMFLEFQCGQVCWQVDQMLRCCDAWYKWHAQHSFTMPHGLQVSALERRKSSRRKQYRLLDVQKAAIAKFGSQAAMLRRPRHTKDLSPFHKTSIVQVVRHHVFSALALCYFCPSN